MIMCVIIQFLMIICTCVIIQFLMIICTCVIIQFLATYEIKLIHVD